MGIMSPEELEKLLEHLQIVGAEQQRVEVKTGVGKSALETLSAFANHAGGIIVLGISEQDGFIPVDSFDALAERDRLVSYCERLTPHVRPEIEVIPVKGKPVLVAHVEELEVQDKPCYVSDRGMYNGSYTRSGDADVKLTRYEIDRLLEERKQPRWDLTAVDDASQADLDATRLDAYLDNQRTRRPRTFESGDEAALNRLRVLQGDNPTLAALLSMGEYPQQFYPRLMVTFALYPGKGKGDVTQGIRLLDSARITGTIPEMVDEGVRLVEKNMRTAGLIGEVYRQDLPDYPPVAVREALVNALMHRDYSPSAQGTPVQIDMYVDRLEISNPGGLYGGVTTENLGRPGASSTRNQQLATFLEELTFPGGGPIAENRGTGIATMNRATADALMPPPKFTNTLTHFTVTFFKHRVAEAETHETAFQQVRRLLAEETSWSTTELVQATGLSRTSVMNALNQLVAEGTAERTEPERSPRQRYRMT
ncbi:putative DNA binding domain-containing protein [Corynebacterium sp. CNCTC7651]|uniref:ATP-binding protein n=1 Tax=Corynebacterium sp. CNCTC7651 TaxID=2815361 RepID=UPI001F33B5BF|nr:ATP-binding protein [Corynebacterium sp. CNCTC7651]UIZ93253.1 putative DNA binding domain-containing protein [Corynebacterium sp. CNCTC7651]